MDESYKLTQEEKATLQYRVTSKLREAILRGEFAKGERLIQEEWAEKLGVSRMPIREALRQLEMEGLVRIEPHRGAIVLPVTVEDVEEIYFLRALLEGIAVEKALPYLEEDDLEELEQLVEEMERLPAVESAAKQYVQLNTRFHRILWGACPWRRIQGMIDMLWKGIPPATPSFLRNQIVEAREEHRLMLDHAKAGRAKELREVMERHILRTRDRLIDFLSKEKKHQQQDPNKSGHKPGART